VEQSELAELARLPLDTRLTAQFYAWERWGRGWTVWPSPVALSHPSGHSAFTTLRLAAHGTVDDGRKATVFSSFFDSVSGRDADQPAPRAEFEAWAEDLSATPDPIPWSVRKTRGTAGHPGGQDQRLAQRAEQLLMGLSANPLPIAFEIIGLPESIAVQLVCGPDEHRHVRDQLAMTFPGSTLLEQNRFLAERWSAAGNDEQLIVDFGLAEEFMCRW